MKQSLIFDFETLSQDPVTGPIVSIAYLTFDEDRFILDGYTWKELTSSAFVHKFDIEEQIKKYGKKVQKDTLSWWQKQSKEAQRQLLPSKDDVSISELHNLLTTNVDMKNIERVYTRGNTFDPVFMTQIMQTTGYGEPYPWWAVRDTRSMIEGMTYGNGISNKFIPEGLEEVFVAHDPVHDIAMDVMRLQTIAFALMS